MMWRFSQKGTDFATSLSKQFGVRQFILTLSFSVLAAMGHTQVTWSVYPFEQGEYLEYKLNYGWFSIGKASFRLDEVRDSMNCNSCLAIKVEGGSSGFLNVFTTVEDEWGALVRKDDLQPVYTYRDIKEGKYRLEEDIHFDYEEGTITVEQYKAHKSVPQRPTRYFEFDTEKGVYDMLGGMMKIRALDLNQFEAGDTIALDAFFEDTFYDFKVAYMGKERVKTKVGKIVSHKLLPIMPENSVFDGKNSLTFWVSADLNQLPVKVTADMFIGKASCEIVGYRNLKYGGDSD